MKKLPGLCLLGLILLAPAAFAGTELIPIYAYRTSGDFEETNTGTTLDVDDEVSYGFALRFDAEPSTQYEFLYSEQSSQLRAGQSFPSNILFDIDITYVHAGGVKLYPVDDTTSYFLGGGLGATIFEPDVSGYDRETKFSFNFSGGVKKMLTKSVGLRAGLSLYGTPVSSGSAIFCGSDSGCTVRFKGDFFAQYDASVGLVVRF